jgi:ribosomal protein S24E
MVVLRVQIVDILNVDLNKIKKNNIIMKKKIAVEIIYDDEKIVGYKEIDPDSIVLGYDVDGTEVWIQYPNDESKKRVLYKTQILTNFYSKDDLESEYEELDLMEKRLTLAIKMLDVKLFDIEWIFNNILKLDINEVSNLKKNK